MRYFPIIIALLLVGCGSTRQLALADIQAPISKGDARLIISRDNSFLFGAGGANVEVSGVFVKTLGLGGAVAQDVHAGRTTVGAYAQDGYGKSILPLDAKAGIT